MEKAKEWIIYVLVALAGGLYYLYSRTLSKAARLQYEKNHEYFKKQSEELSKKYDAQRARSDNSVRDARSAYREYLGRVRGDSEEDGQGDN